MFLVHRVCIEDPPDNNVYAHYQHIYSTSLLFIQVDIEDPPDISVYEHYQHIYIAHVCCSKRLTIRTHPTTASMNIAEVSWSKRLTSRSHQTTSSMNIIKARFQKINASSQQSCGTDNRTERLTSGTHGPDHRLLHRAT
jgi:hypothetical protein